MIDDTLARDLRADEVAPGFVRPAWGTHSFANVPDTITSLFGGESARPLPSGVFDGAATDVEHVLVVLVDGFGWNHFERVREDHPFLTTLAEHATVTPLTSICPTETAAAVSTIHTGTQPAEHGVLGWNAHVPELGGFVQTLPFADHERTPLGEVFDEPDPGALIDTQPLYERLDARSVLVQPAEIGDNPYDRQVTRGAATVGYENAPQAAYRVREQLETATEPTYCYCYFPTVDALSHEMGAFHPETDAQLGAICGAIEREIVAKLDPETASETLLILTADHGEVDATPETTVDLGTLDLDAHLKRDGSGETIPALGGPRNLQFHARDGHRRALRAELEAGLAPLDPLLLSRERLLDERLFGDRDPSERFVERCPDLLVIPEKGFAWYDDGHLSNVGMHGGMHPDEMLVPFAAARIGALQNPTS